VSTTIDLHEELVGFLRDYYRDDLGELAQHYPNERQSLTIDIDDIVARFAADERPDVHLDVYDRTEQVRRRFEDAIADVTLPGGVSLTDVNVRFSGLTDADTYRIGEYHTKQLGELLAIRGQVNKATQSYPRIVDAAFECVRCGTLTRVPQDEGWQEPHECQGCERQGPFQIRQDECDLKEEQKLRIQLPPEDQHGQTDADIDVTVDGDLVDTVNVGDRVTAAGVLQGTFGEGDDPGAGEYTARLDDVDINETDFTDIDVTEEDLERIREIASDDPYQTIVDSIAPSLQGIDEIKLAIGLQLFGGTRKTLPDGSVERGISHVLLIGDPGTGKSALLSWADNLAPRSIYSDGKGSSAAGLTASAVRDDFGGDQWTIEGGTIVKAHNGLACIDELDDMDPDDRSALHTALEKQEVPVAKAGINTRLPARATLLAAANPKHGRFDEYEPIADQIDLKPTLFSRFDLIFTLSDRPERDRDTDIAGHKLNTAEVGQRIEAGAHVPDTMRERVEPAVEPELMRAYIAHAKTAVTPVYTDAAKQLAKEEFVALRMANAEQGEDPDHDDPVPVTYRKMEAFTRIAEASARVRLSDEITVEDVERATTLIKSCLADVGLDHETGEFDADIVETGTSKSQSDRMKTVKATIAELENESSWGAPESDVIGAASSEGLTESAVHETITELKTSGEVYEPGKNDGEIHYRTT